MTKICTKPLMVVLCIFMYEICLFHLLLLYFVAVFIGMV